MINAAIATDEIDGIECHALHRRPYLFSNSVAPSVVGASLKVFEMLEKDSSYVNKVGCAQGSNLASVSIDRWQCQEAGTRNISSVQLRSVGGASPCDDGKQCVTSRLNRRCRHLSLTTRRSGP